MTPRRLRSVLRVGSFVAVTAAMVPAYLLGQRLLAGEDPRRHRNRWTRRWSRTLRRVFDVEVEVAGTVPDERGFLVVSNHRAALDILVLLETFGGHLVSRGDLSAWPLIGQAARSVGTVFVDRSSRTSGALVLREVAEILSSGENVLLFPEGTTFEGDLVRPFPPAAFLPAIRAARGVLPVGLAYETGSESAFVGETFGAHLLRASGSQRTRVALTIGAPLSVQTTDRRMRTRELAAGAERAVQACVEDARVRVDRSR